MWFSEIDSVFQEECLYVTYMHITIDEIREFQRHSFEAGPGCYYVCILISFNFRNPKF